MTNSTDILRRVKDLTIQGSSDVLTPAAKEGIAAELEGLKQNLLSQANATFMGRNVFAGNSDAGVAFTSGSPAAYTGTGSTVDRRVADGVTVRVDADGAAIFGTGAGSAFDLIDKIAADLRSGANASSNISALDERMSTLVAEHAAIGARDAQIQRAQDVNVTQQGNLEATRAGIEDVDMSKAILDLQLQSTNYQAALAVTAKVLPPTLMDFLR